MKQAALTLHIFSLIIDMKHIIIIRQFSQQLSSYFNNAMLYRSQQEKAALAANDKFKNIQVNIKKHKKNRNNSPNKLKTHYPKTIREKEEMLIQVKKTDVTQRSLSRSKERSISKATLKLKDEDKVKKTNKKLHNSPTKLEQKLANVSSKKSPPSTSKSPSTSRKQTTVRASKQNKELSPLENTKRQLFCSDKKEKPSPHKSKHKSQEKKNNNTKQKALSTKKLEKAKKKAKDEKISNKHENVKVEEVSSQQSSQAHEYLQSKFKPKGVSEIKIKFSSRKQSCIDEELLDKLHHHKNNKNIDFIESCFLKSIRQDEQNQASRRLQPDTCKKQEKKKEAIDIQTFKREQERRWKSMLEQIKNLKHEEQIAQKIDILIYQITQNYQSLQVEAKSIGLYCKIDKEQQQPQQLEEQEKTYSNISIINQHYEQQQQIPHEGNRQSSRTHMISLDDFFKGESSSKRQLFLFKEQEKKSETMEQIIQHDSDRLMPSALIKSIEITEEDYIKEQKTDQEVIHFYQISISSHQIQQLLVTKSQYPCLYLRNCTQQQRIALTDKVAIEVQQIILDEFCNLLISNKRLLHYFLANFDNQLPLNNEVSYLQQPASNQYVFFLIHKLLDHLFTSYRQYFYTQISYQYECKPLEILRYVRCTQEEDQEEMSFEIQKQNEIQIPFFSLEKIYEFQIQVLNNDQYLPSYFTFNHCVYDAFNDVIDSIRPYGAKGKSIFTLQLSHSLKSQPNIRHQIQQRFSDIIRFQFDQQTLKDDLIHGEQGNFQITYFVSVQVMESIYNEAVLEIYQLLRKQFQ